jgi:hypothetical protein
VTDEPLEGGRRRVRRGEGEVTEWPRGLVDYLPSGAPDSLPSPEEDRDLNRMRLAARLLGLAHADGHPVEAAVRRLHDADRAFRAGDRPNGRRIVDEVLTEVERLSDAAPPSRTPTS